MQLPVQALSIAHRGAVGERRRRRRRPRAAPRRRATAPGSSTSRCATTSRSRASRAEMMRRTWYDPVATLGFLAAQTTNDAADDQRVRRRVPPPAETAKAFATLDALSGGRVILGVGAGHVEGEFDALGFRSPTAGKLARRGDRRRRREAWTSEFVPSGDTSVGMTAASGAAAAAADLDRRLGEARAAAGRGERGDGWIPQGTPAQAHARRRSRTCASTATRCGRVPSPRSA